MMRSVFVVVFCSCVLAGASALSDHGALTRRAALQKGVFAGVVVPPLAASALAPATAVLSPTTTQQQQQETRVRSELMSGLAGGAAQRIAKDVVLHPFDTVKTRVQRKDFGGTFLSRRALANPYAGVLAPLVVGVPAGALFFGVKDATAALLGGFNEDLVELVTVAVANGPYWLVRSPAELVKVRAQLDDRSNVSGFQLAKDIYQTQGGLPGLYVGAKESYSYALPTDLVKFYVYRKLKTQFKSRVTTNAILKKAALGSLASAAAQLATTPLDVVRTRTMDLQQQSFGGRDHRAALKASEEALSSPPIPARLRAIAADEGLPALWAGLTPKLLRSVVSGALQFGSYEFTKRVFRT